MLGDVQRKEDSLVSKYLKAIDQLKNEIRELERQGHEKEKRWLYEKQEGYQKVSDAELRLELASDKLKDSYTKGLGYENEIQRLTLETMQLKSTLKATQDITIRLR